MSGTNPTRIRRLAREARAALNGVRFRAAVGTVVILLIAFWVLTWLGARAVASELESRLTAEAVAAVDFVAADIAAGADPGSVPWRPSAALAWRATWPNWEASGTISGNAHATRALPEPQLDPDEYRVVVAADHSSVAATRTVEVGGDTVAVETFAAGPSLVNMWSTLSVGAAPFIALGTVALVWWVVGRALGPVERMRAAASRVGVTEDISTRLPEVGGADEIAALAKTLNEMLDRIEEASLSQRAFISDAGHELRSPLTAIRTLLGTPGDIDGHTRELLNDACRRLEVLVEDLFTLARLDEWGLVAIDDVDVDDLCDRVAATVAAQHPHLRVEVDARPARVRGDAAALERVLTNLCTNAARHTRTLVEITCTTHGGRVHLSVSDDGDGVPEAMRERIFERFARLDESRSRDAGGAGLGLAIVARTVEAHQGTIDVADRPGGGAAFHITLPVDGPDRP